MILKQFMFRDLFKLLKCKQKTHVLLQSSSKKKIKEISVKKI